MRQNSGGGPPTPALEPWERQPGESEKRWSAFVAYRDQPAGQRSLRGLARQLGRGGRLLQQWSSEDGWQRRVAAWDRHSQRVHQRAVERELDRLGERHANVLAAVVHVLQAPVQQFLQRMADARAAGDD